MTPDSANFLPTSHIARHFGRANGRNHVLFLVFADKNDGQCDESIVALGDV